MYKKELDQFLEHLDTNISAAQSSMQKHGFTNPAQTIKNVILLAQTSLSKKELSALNSLFELDPQSGYHQHYLHAAITGLMYDYSELSGCPMGVIEFDYENNKETKKILGTERMDQVFRLVNGIIAEEFQKQNPNVIYPTRINMQGDEYRILTLGLTPKDLKQACNRAKKRIEEFSLKTGLYALKHPKKPENSSANGFSVGFGSIVLDDSIQDEYELKTKLESEISRDKKLSGRKREKSVLQKKSNGEHISSYSFSDADVALNKKQSIYFDFILAATKNCLGAPTSPYPDASPNCSYIVNRSPFETTTETALRQASEGSLLHKLIELKFQKDPLSGGEPLLYLIRDWNNFKNDLVDQGMTGIFADFELRNLPGMNDYLGGENTDCVISHASRILHSSLEKEFGHDNVKIHSTFGGRMKVFILNDDINDVKKAFIHAEHAIDKQINQKSVAEYFQPQNIQTNGSKINNMKDIPNTLYKGRQGVYARFSMMKFTPDLTAEEHLIKLENQIQPEIKQALWAKPKTPVHKSPNKTIGK